MKEVLDSPGERKKKKNPLLSPRLGFNSKRRSGVGRMKAESGQVGGQRTLGLSSIFSYSLSFILSFPSSSELQKSLLKSNSGLSCSVGNHGRSEKEGVVGKAASIPTQARKVGAAIARLAGSCTQPRADSQMSPTGTAQRGGRGESQSRRTLSTLEAVPWERLRKRWRTDTWQVSG